MCVNWFCFLEGSLGQLTMGSIAQGHEHLLVGESRLLELELRYSMFMFLTAGAIGFCCSGSRREPDALNPGNNLYVTGLSTRVNEKDLQEHFSQEGKVRV